MKSLKVAPKIAFFLHIPVASGLPPFMPNEYFNFRHPYPKYGVSGKQLNWNLGTVIRLR